MHLKLRIVTRIHKDTDLHVATITCYFFHAETHTNSFHERPVTTDAGKARKASCENALNSLLLTCSTPPVVLMPHSSHTASQASLLLLFPPLSEQNGLMEGNRLFLHQSRVPSHYYYFFKYHYITSYSDSSPPCYSSTHHPTSATPPPSVPLCLNSNGPGEQTKKGLCPKRKRCCVTQRGDNVLLVALNLKLLQYVFVCPSPIVCSSSLSPKHIHLLVFHFLSATLVSWIVLHGCKHKQTEVEVS